MKIVMPRSTSAAARVHRPSTSSTGVVTSTLTARYAATSGGSSGTWSSSVKSASAALQSASLVMPEFQNTVATARRSGTASTLYGTLSRNAIARRTAATTVLGADPATVSLIRLSMRLSHSVASH